jgi:hypothetical protein
MHMPVHICWRVLWFRMLSFDLSFNEKSPTTPPGTRFSTLFNVAAIGGKSPRANFC